MYRSALRGAAAAALTVTLAALTVSCGNDAEPKTKASPPAASASPTSSAPAPGAASPSAATGGTGTPGPAATPTAKPTAQASDGGLPTTSPELVRDAFAGLQATLNDSCTPGNCAYFLGRVYDELHRLDRAMKADRKGPGHFPEPIALIVKLDKELGGDRTFENLKKHQDALIGTRDQINTWMQDHPDDYR
ncbi:hypothetical protein ACQKM2_09030 [Streptomyces sp. NPDC004126]|uniref:hypothetical protein n=1 Tax=Streptomyces sp. NPDC004126 TaxID=3390695 RepID=UPI003D082DA2